MTTEPKADERPKHGRERKRSEARGATNQTQTEPSQITREHRWPPHKQTHASHQPSQDKWRVEWEFSPHDMPPLRCELRRAKQGNSTLGAGAMPPTSPRGLVESVDLKTSVQHQAMESGRSIEIEREGERVHARRRRCSRGSLRVGGSTQGCTQSLEVGEVARSRSSSSGGATRSRSSTR